jgi:hypothetical protein
MSTPIVSDADGFSLERGELNLIRANIYFGFAVLAVGVLLGLEQAFNYAGVDLVRHYPVINSYYQGLTIHGVFNALVLTTAFANGFITLTTARGLNRRLPPILVGAAFWSMLLGSLMAAWAMLTGKATVLYTFYPPLEAHWAFYLGLALVVISTWITSAAQLAALRGWRKDNPGRRVPLLAFMSIATYVMWDIASVGIAIEVVVLLLPWSLGILPGSDPKPHPVLVHRASHRVLLAAAGLRFLVRDDPQTKRRRVVQRFLDPRRLHSVHSAGARGVPSPVPRSRCLAGTQVHSGGADLCDLLSQPDDCLRRDVRARDRRTPPRRDRSGRMVFRDSLERPFGVCAGARDARFPAGRHLGPGQRQLHT